MTPTPAVLLLVALVWTLPASAAALAYRKHDNSLENLKAAFQRPIERGAGRPELQPQPDA